MPSKVVRAWLPGVLIAILLSLTGCPDAGSNNSAYVSQLQSDITSLRSENDDLKSEIKVLKDKIKRDGYFAIPTWIALPLFVALFCAGLACGMKIKRSVLNR